MVDHEQYILRVTAGATYDTSKHEDVNVNSENPVAISSDLLDAKIHIRIKDYRGRHEHRHASATFLTLYHVKYLRALHMRHCTNALYTPTGLPKGAPSTSPYFSTPQHPYDRYSISFSFTPKKSVDGHHMVFGNDFEHPIRDRLPPLFDKAFGIVKWWIDPGLDGDVYGDEPYLYGALLSSINVLRIGSKDQTSLQSKNETEAEEKIEEGVEDDDVVVYEEGAEGDGVSLREEKGIPSVAGQRQKHFLNEQNRKDFEFEAGREYKCDFFNPYLDFNEFALKLGYGLPAISIISHWDGQPLRYVVLLRESSGCRNLTNQAHTPLDMFSRTRRQTLSCLWLCSSSYQLKRRERRGQRIPRRN
jgi:hypothetical protein